MPAKKNPQRAAKKPSGGITLTDRERAAGRKRVEADMKKHGFTTVDQLMKYYDSKRGY